MSLSYCVLGSGSGGNSTLVICDNASQPIIPGGSSSPRADCFLVDCGLSPRATNKRMAASGRTIDDITAIVLTHLDTDHFYGGWRKLIERRNLPIYVHHRHRAVAWRAGLTARQTILFTDGVQLECGAHATAMLLAHDELGSVGYVFEYGGFRLGYATDLGRVPSELFDLFTNIDALALESNYDRDMQMMSARPVFLKRRIMGGNGHLSNVQAIEAVHRIVERSSLSHISLLHLSRQCNDPAVVRRLYTCEAPHLLDRLTITNQHVASPLLTVCKRPPEASCRDRIAMIRDTRVRPAAIQLRLFG